MTPDEIIEVLQGSKAGRKWGYGMSVSGSLVESADQSVKALIANISLGFEVALMPLPDEITLPARVIPAPLRKALEDRDGYYTIDLFDSDGVTLVEWGSDSIDFELLADGLIFATREHAIAFRKAMCPYA